MLSLHLFFFSSLSFFFLSPFTFCLSLGGRWGEGERNEYWFFGFFLSFDCKRWLSRVCVCFFCPDQSILPYLNLMLIFQEEESEVVYKAKRDLYKTKDLT